MDSVSWSIRVLAGALQPNGYLLSPQSGLKGVRPRLEGKPRMLLRQDATFLLQSPKVKFQELPGLTGFLSLVKHPLEGVLEPLDCHMTLAEFLSQLRTRSHTVSGEWSAHGMCVRC